MQLYANLTPAPCTPALMSALMKGGVALPARRSASNANEGARHMNSKHLAVLTLALSATLAAGGAHAGGRPDVQWSVTIGSPPLVLMVDAPVYAQPVYAPYGYAPHGYATHAHGSRVYYPQPVAVVVPQRRGVYRAGWRDADRDGIPNRYDRECNPRGDRDGDGVPNRRDRYDRSPNRR